MKRENRITVPKKIGALPSDRLCDLHVDARAKRWHHGRKAAQCPACLTNREQMDILTLTGLAYPWTIISVLLAD